jgi:hypothetical protein
MLVLDPHLSGFYSVSATNVSLNKKHLRGVTEVANSVSEKLDGETFNEQIESISSLVGHRIAFSKIRNVILGEGDVPKINHRKMDAFKNSIRWSRELNDISKEIRNMIHTPSDQFGEVIKRIRLLLRCILGISDLSFTFQERGLSCS